MLVARITQLLTRGTFTAVTPQREEKSCENWMNEHSLDTPPTADTLRTDHPAVDIRISPGARSDAVAGAILRAQRHGHRALVGADVLAELVRPIIEIDSAALNRRNRFISSANNINSMVCNGKHIIPHLVTSKRTTVAIGFPADYPLTMWYRDRIGQPRQPTRPSDTGSSQSGSVRNRGHPHGGHIRSRCLWKRNRFRETNG